LIYVTDSDSGTAAGPESPARRAGSAARGTRPRGGSQRSATRDEQPDAPGDQAEALSYEQARDELASVVKRLEAGGLTLEQSLELWERGERLAAICGELLEGARARLAGAMAEQPGDGDPDAPF
jgi:exodeoxyribonuclease VII small subunit